MSQRIIKQLNELKSEVKPSVLFKEQTKDYILSSLSQEEMVSYNVFSSWLRPVTISSVMGVFMFVFSFGIIHASQDALPGSMLYDVKLTSEKVKSTFVMDPAKKTQMEIRYANARVQELQTLSTKQNVKPEHVKKALGEYKESIDTLKQQLEGNTYKQHDSVVEIAKMIDSTKQELDKSVKEVKKRVTSDDQELSKQIKEVQENTEHIRNKALAVIIEDYNQKHQEQEKVKESFNTLIADKIEDSEKRLEQIKEDPLATASVDEEQKEVMEPEVIKEENQTTDDELAQITQEKTVSVQEVKKQLNEVKELLKEGQDLPNVLNKLEETQKDLKTLEEKTEFAEIKPLNEVKQDEETFSSDVVKQQEDVLEKENVEEMTKKTDEEKKEVPAEGVE